MADNLEKDLSRSEKILKDRLISIGKVAKDITNKAFRELVDTMDSLNKSLDDISYELEKQLKTYSEIKGQTKELGTSLNKNLNYVKNDKDLHQKLVGIYKDQNKLIDKLVRNKEDLLTGELSSKRVNDDLLKVKTQNLNIALRQQDITDEITRKESELKGVSKDKQENIKI